MSDPYSWLCDNCGALNYRPEGPGFRAKYEFRMCWQCETINEVEADTRDAVARDRWLYHTDDGTWMR